MSLQCDCQQPLNFSDIEEVEQGNVFARFRCAACGWTVGVEGAPKELDPLVPPSTWSDEATYHLSRLPPYLGLLVKDEVETFARAQQFRLLTYPRLVAARNKGMVDWSPNAEQRLANVPSGIRAMAKVELERTALDRGMQEVTVTLMEEVKARYFGMATGRS